MRIRFNVLRPTLAAKNGKVRITASISCKWSTRILLASPVVDSIHYYRSMARTASISFSHNTTTPSDQDPVGYSASKAGGKPRSSRLSIERAPQGHV